mgnify:CR=1 FL=1
MCSSDLPTESLKVFCTELCYQILHNKAVHNYYVGGMYGGDAEISSISHSVFLLANSGKTFFFSNVIYANKEHKYIIKNIIPLLIKCVY